MGKIQDAQGQLWIASTNGIIRFDGRQFQVYHDPVLKEVDFYYHVVPSANGRIWLKMGSGNALSYVDPRQERVVRVPDTTRLVRGYLAKYGSHFFFIDAQDKLWIGLKGHGLLKVDTRTFAVEHVVDQSLQVRGITQDHRGTIYFATSNQGFFAYDPPTGKLTNYRHQESDGQSLSSNATFGVQARPDGSILIGQVNEVSLFWPATGKFRPLGLNTHDPRTTDPQYQSLITEFKPDAQGLSTLRRNRASFATRSRAFFSRLASAHPPSLLIVYMSIHQTDCGSSRMPNCPNMI